MSSLSKVKSENPDTPMQSDRNMEMIRITSRTGINRMGRRIMLILIDLCYDKLNVMGVRFETDI